MADDSMILTRFDDRGEAGRIAWVIFNDPKRRNALGVAGKEQFITTLAALRHDPRSGRSCSRVPVTGPS